MAGERSEGGGEAREERWRIFRAVEESMPVFTKELVAGGVAGGIAKTAVAPLERVKILFQTRRSDFQRAGVLGSFQKIMQREGMKGFYRGNGASVARIVPYAALHYMAYEQYRRLIILSSPTSMRGPVLDLLSGSMSGGTAVLLTYPLDLVRTKLAYQVVGPTPLTHTPQHVYKGIVDCIASIYKSCGIRGLYRGIGPSLYGIFPYSGLKFYFYEEMKTHVADEYKGRVAVNLACGSIAGLLGQTLTYPLDVVRRQMQVPFAHPVNPCETSRAVPGEVNGKILPFQVNSLAESTRAGRGTLGSLVMIVRRQGWQQLFSGLSINYLKVVPSVAIGFTVYDRMKSLLRVPSRDGKTM